LQALAKEPLRREAAQKLKQINVRDAKHRKELFLKHDWLSGPVPELKPGLDGEKVFSPGEAVLSWLSRAFSATQFVTI
jgi:hypothetical protein